MNVFAVLGSPRRTGHTATLLDQVLAGAAKAGAATERVDLYPLTIGPCMACDACRKPGKPGCVRKDDMQSLYPKVLDADVLVWATPMYWWNMSAVLKQFVDRLYGLPGELKGKTLLLVMTTEADPAEDGREGLDLLLKEICGYTGMTYAGILTAGSSTLPVSEQPDVLAAAFAKGQSLVSK